MGVVFGVLVGGFALAVLVVVVVGARLPARHVATRVATYTRPPRLVWSAITEVARQPEWRKDVKRVDVLPERGGRHTWREVGPHGPVTFEEAERDEPRRLVVRTADPDLPFSGTWTFEVAPEGAGATLRITEDAEVRNPLFRFVSRYVLGQTKTIEGYLVALGESFGEPTKPRP